MGHMTSETPQIRPNPNIDLAGMRLAYPEIPLDLEHLDLDPYRQFSHWLVEANQHPAIIEANGMVLATVGSDGRPSTRTLLLKGTDHRGFIFFTNYESKKATDISSNPNASMTFPWLPLFRQVNIVGIVNRVPREESEAYFATRPWGSRIGAWASLQSTPLPDRTALEERWAHFAHLYPEGTEVPAPPNWGGFVLTPTQIEFWQGRRSRLHDRLRYEWVNNSHWQITRYYP